jgi:peptidoglycan hydrolase-like amidase
VRLWRRAGSSALVAALAAVTLAGACARGGPEPKLPPPAAESPATATPAPTEVPAPLEAPAEEPVTAAPPLPPAVETAPEPVAGEAPTPPDPARGPILLRVGLASDLGEVRLPGDGGARVIAATAGEPVTLVTPLFVRPGGAVASAAVFRLQAAALRDEGQARELARRLAESTGEPADVGFDAASGLYKVRLGRWPVRAEADAARTRLAGRGVSEAWVVSEGGGVIDPELHLAVGGREIVAPGRWLAIEGDPERGIAAGASAAGRFRGRLLVYLNDRGRLNLINELPLEDYLRGVVPAEMGPELYPRLEALKAQAVAARTYTLRNLGEFEGEGFDICATPRCQVYRGIAAEHPLSDRAIAETAGQVLLWRGELVDARYSATCGGHTEDVRTVFPLEDAPYLRGVPCVENGADRLGGALPRGEPFPEALVRRLFPAEADGSADELLASLEEVAGFYRALETVPSGVRLLVLRVGGEERRIELPAALATFRLRGERLESADLALVPGDRVSLYRFDGYPVALVQGVDPAGASRDRAGPYGSWSRFRSDARLARLVEERYPGLGFTGFEVLERGVSGRVGKMRLLGAGGRSVVVEGLAVRWTLDLPDTRFTAQRHRTGRSEAGYLFTGSGWGHGVGLCQLGAYGMAGRRHGYRQILQHYYSGVTLARVRARAPRWSRAAPAP